jgi:long-chain acyl-CoA synthetase
MLTGLLSRNSATRPSQAAIVQGNRRISHQDLELESGRWAARLCSLGVGQGDAVAIVLPNCPEFVMAFFAIMRLQAIAMPLNPAYTPAEIGRFLSEKPVRAVIADTSTAAACSAAGCAQVIVPGGEADFAPLEASGEPFAGDALYLFTSGSTGSTKRVLFTQRNLYYEALNFVESTGIGAGDPILCPVPLYHSYGLCLGMLDAAYTGATLVLEPEPDAPFTSRRPCMLALLREENVSVLPAVPWQFAVIADSPDDLCGYFQNVKWCMSSGDMLPRRTYDRFLDRTGRRIRSFYGSTEAGSVTMETGREEEVEFESAGRPLKNVSIAIRDSTGAAAASRDIGELWIKSPAVAAGYDNDPASSKTIFRDGWFNSGDLGSIDGRGRLFLSGRKQALISVGSYKVDATEVEEALLEIPGVREAAVVGVEIPDAGTLVKAVLAMGQEKPPASPQAISHQFAEPGGAGGFACPKREKEVRAFCIRRLAMYKVPRIVEFVSELPRDPMGKILRRELASADRYVSTIRDAAALGALSRIQHAPAARQRAMVIQMVERQAAAVLGRAGEPIPRDAGFADLGMDSFGSMELLTRLELLFGPGLSQTFTYDYPSISAAADALVERLRSACV